MRSRSDGPSANTASKRARDIARRREDRHRDGVERKHPPAAAARLNLRLGRFDDRVNDLERLARSGSHESADGAIECAGEPRFEVSGLSQKIHVALLSPLRAAARCGRGADDFASRGRRRDATVAGMLDDDGECDPLLRHASTVRTGRTRRTSRATSRPETSAVPVLPAIGTGWLRRLRPVPSDDDLAHEAAQPPRGSRIDDGLDLRDPSSRS